MTVVACHVSALQQTEEDMKHATEQQHASRASSPKALKYINDDVIDLGMRRDMANQAIGTVLSNLQWVENMHVFNEEVLPSAEKKPILTRSGNLSNVSNSYCENVLVGCEADRNRGNKMSMDLDCSFGQMEQVLQATEQTTEHEDLVLFKKCLNSLSRELSELRQMFEGFHQDDFHCRTCISEFEQSTKDLDSRLIMLESAGTVTESSILETSNKVDFLQTQSNMMSVLVSQLYRERLQDFSHQSTRPRACHAPMSQGNVRVEPRLEVGRDISRTPLVPLRTASLASEIECNEAALMSNFKDAVRTTVKPPNCSHYLVSPVQRVSEKKTLSGTRSMPDVRLCSGGISRRWSCVGLHSHTHPSNQKHAPSIIRRLTP